MARYIKVTRSDASGRYIIDRTGLLTAIDGEFDDLEWDEPGTTVTLEVVEMTEDEFAALPEFEGW